MKILVIDFETTGLDVQTCQVLQFACMVLDTDDPWVDNIEQSGIVSLLFAYPFICYGRKDLSALPVNIHYANKLTGKSPLASYDQVIECVSNDDKTNDDLVSYAMSQVLGELDYESPIVLGGKNVEKFDAPIFGRLMPHYKVARRCVDPTYFFVDYRTGGNLPSLSVIVTRLKDFGHYCYSANAHDAAVDVYHTGMAIWEMARRSFPSTNGHIRNESLAQLGRIWTL